MSRPFRQARPRKSVARQLVVETTLLLFVLLLIAIALPIYFGADPAAPISNGQPAG